VALSSVLAPPRAAAQRVRARAARAAARVRSRFGARVRTDEANPTSPDLVAKLLPPVLLPFHALHLVQVTAILWADQMSTLSPLRIAVGYGALYAWFSIAVVHSIKIGALGRNVGRLAPVTTAIFIAVVFPGLSVDAWRVHGLWLGLACADSIACVAALEYRRRVLTAVSVVMLAVLTVAVAAIDGLTSLGSAAFGLVASNIGGVAFVAFGLAQIVRQSAKDRAEVEAELAVARERNRLHRLIHDSALQPLEALGGGWDVDIEHIRSEARHQAGLLRAAIRGESGLDVLVFSDRLKALAKHWDTRGLDVKLRLRADDALVQPGVADALAGATNEALSNVAKHAGVRRVDVDSFVRNDRFHVVVSDEGTGFDPGAALSSGRLGLSLSVQTCMADIGGGAEIKSAVGNGTTITLWVPC
jgi:signal transduction histidine kinase